MRWVLSLNYEVEHNELDTKCLRLARDCREE